MEAKMGHSQVETCQIRLGVVPIEGSGPVVIVKALFSSIVSTSLEKDDFRWIAEIITSTGTKKIAESEKFTLEVKIFGREGRLPSPEDAAVITTQARLIRQQLLQRLQSDGWEFVTVGQDDRVMTLKRGKTPPSSLGDSDPTELLKKLASLRDAGIITSDEFETKKAEILKRL
jgi:hypothetical protein